MKKNLCFVVLCLLLTSLYAQTEKDNLLIGGDFNLNYVFVEDADDSFSFNVSAATGYFLQDNLVLGGGLNYSLGVFGSANVTSTSVGIFPLFRYYFASEMPVKFFIDLRPGFVATVVNYDFGEDSDAGFNFRGGPGLAVFLSNDISVDMSLNYYRDYNFNNSTTNRIGFNVGLQAFINNKKE